MGTDGRKIGRRTGPGCGGNTRTFTYQCVCVWYHLNLDLFLLLFREVTLCVRVNALG